jgi:hypothetical protein
MLDTWAQLEPTAHLTLLDAIYSDPVIRQFAVNCLDELNDSDIMLYLL